MKVEPSFCLKDSNWIKLPYSRSIGGLKLSYVIINIACAFIRERCRPRLRYLNKAVSWQIYKKYNRQHASAKLDICTARIEGCRAGPRALLHALCHYALRAWHRAKILLADFNLAVSIPTAKPANLIPRQIFRLYSITKSTKFCTRSWPFRPTLVEKGYDQTECKRNGPSSAD